MKKLFLTLIIAFAAVCGFAQEKVWEDVVTGYRTSSVFNVNKVWLYPDRTDVLLHIDFIAGRQALSHSKELYERMAQYDIVFLYLANRSDDESWKNVIKEYNVTGGNVVHYNLPAQQQGAVENFLKVNQYPSYRLTDRNGNLVDVDAGPHNLDAFENLIKVL